MSTAKFRKNIKFKEPKFYDDWPDYVRKQSPILRYVYSSWTTLPCKRVINEHEGFEEYVKETFNATLYYGEAAGRYTSITFRNEGIMTMLLLKIPSNY